MPLEHINDALRKGKCNLENNTNKRKKKEKKE